LLFCAFAIFEDRRCRAGYTELLQIKSELFFTRNTKSLMLVVSEIHAYPDKTRKDQRLMR
jgi:hypothetical protein